MRVWIFGAPGSGKSTMAETLSRRYRVPHFELDNLFWAADWVVNPDDVFTRAVRHHIDRTDWIMDGNYQSASKIISDRVQLALWIDLPFAVTYPRVLARTVRNVIAGTPLFSGNVETFARALSRDGMPNYALRTHGRNQARFANFFASVQAEKHRLTNHKTALQDATLICDALH